MRTCCLFVVLVACGDPSPQQQTADAALDATPDGAGECNALALPTASVMNTRVASTPPTAQGGVITDGSYVVTDVKTYTGSGGPSGPTGNPAVGADQVIGARFMYRTRDLVSGTEDVRTGTFTTNGSNLVTTNTCPDSQVTNFTFDATATAFTLYQVQGSQTLALTFTKQ